MVLISALNRSQQSRTYREITRSRDLEGKVRRYPLSGFQVDTYCLRLLENQQASFWPTIQLGGKIRCARRL
jgi:hypothetical protein